jgi:uncharacterized membrane protein
MITNQKATIGQLWKLHRLVLNALVSYFATTPADKMRAAMLAVAVQFLAHNGVVLDASPAVTTADALKKLADIDLPFGTTTTKQ